MSDTLYAFLTHRIDINLWIFVSFAMFFVRSERSKRKGSRFDKVWVTVAVIFAIVGIAGTIATL